MNIQLNLYPVLRSEIFKHYWIIQRGKGGCILNKLFAVITYRSFEQINNAAN